MQTQYPYLGPGMVYKSLMPPRNSTGNIGSPMFLFPDMMGRIVQPGKCCDYFANAKLGHSQIQIRPQGVKTGQYQTVQPIVLGLGRAARTAREALSSVTSTPSESAQEQPKLCPFCGKDDLVTISVSDDTPFGNHDVIRCLVCYGEAPHMNWNIRARLAAQVEQPWMPIETAPRDGTRILAIGGGLANQAEVVSYNERVGCWNAPNDTLDDRDDDAEGYNRPTHWQPISAFVNGSTALVEQPKAPASAQVKGEGQ